MQDSCKPATWFWHTLDVTWYRSTDFTVDFSPGAHGFTSLRRCRRRTSSCCGCHTEQWWQAYGLCCWCCSRGRLWRSWIYRLYYTARGFVKASLYNDTLTISYLPFTVIATKSMQLTSCLPSLCVLNIVNWSWRWGGQRWGWGRWCDCLRCLHACILFRSFKRLCFLAMPLLWRCEPRLARSWQQLGERGGVHKGGS